MSTKAIRDALDRLQAAAHNADDDGIWNLALYARAEVEAIEKAAERRARLSEAIADGDTAALERLVEMAAEEAIAAQRNAGTAGAAGPKDGASGPQE